MTVTQLKWKSTGSFFHQLHNKERNSTAHATWLTFQSSDRPWLCWLAEARWCHLQLYHVYNILLQPHTFLLWNNHYPVIFRLEKNSVEKDLVQWVFLIPFSRQGHNIKKMDHKEHPHQGRYLWYISSYLSLETDHKNILIFPSTSRIKKKIATRIDQVQTCKSIPCDFSLLLMCRVSHRAPPECKHKLNLYNSPFKKPFCAAQNLLYPATSMKLLPWNITLAQMLLLFSN